MNLENGMNSPVTPVVKKKSNGQLFKEKFGYSKTMKRLMKKHEVSSIAEYKEIRKARKKKENKLAKDHRATVQAKRKAKGTKK
jgi:hypothetical protein